MGRRRDDALCDGLAQTPSRTAMASRGRDLLRLPDDLEANLRKFLATPPPPHDTPGSRKAKPKPPAKPRKKKRAPLTPGPEPSQAALKAQAAHKRAKLATKVTGKKR